MANSLQKFLKQNIDASFIPSEDGKTYDVTFGNTKVNMDKAAGNTLKTILQKKLTGTKYRIGGGQGYDVIKKLNGIADQMLKANGLTNKQKEILDVESKLKNKVLT
jgi:hypothetical protein